MSLAAPAGAVFATDGVGVIDEGLSAEEILVASEEVADISDQVTNTSLPDSDVNQLEVNPGVVPVQPARESEDPPIVSPPPIVIAQIQVGVSGNAKDEYVALYNNGDEDVDITGWCVRNRNLVDFACFTGGDTDYILQAHAFIAVSSQLRTDTQTMQIVFQSCAANSGCIVASSDAVRLVDKDKQVIDTLEWSSQPSGSYAIERQWDVTKTATLAVWVWRKQLIYYGYIVEPVECFDGTIVLDESSCSTLETVPCDGIMINEIAANTDKQFVELYNPTDASLPLTGCRLQTNRSKTVVYTFGEGISLQSKEYVVVYIEDTLLTLTKTAKGIVSLVSLDGVVEADSVSYANLASMTSWAIFDDGWKQTYTPTPGAVNSYAQYAVCDDGYYRNLTTGRCNKIIEATVLSDCGEGRERNPMTGRCRNVPTAKELSPCREGQYRNEETNRCRSILLAVSTLKPCADDQFRNPATNRCKKIASSDDVALADCGEGRERNPMTNRCRNVKSTTPPAAGFAVEPTEDTVSVFVGWWILGGVMAIALGYAGWEWREEIGRIIRKVMYRSTSRH